MLVRLLSVVFVLLSLFCPGGVYAEALGGDINGDGRIEPGDIFALISYAYYYGAEPLGSGDFDGDGAVAESDVQYLTDLVYGLRPLAEGTIGPAGGTLERGGFSLAIPPGALTENTALTVVVGEPLVEAKTPSTKRYKIFGFPDDLSAEITIKLPLLPGAQAAPALRAKRIIEGIEFQEKEVAEVRGWGWFNSSSAMKAWNYVVEAGREVYQTGERLVFTAADVGIAAADGLEVMGVGRRQSGLSAYFELLLTNEQYAKYRESAVDIANTLDEFHRTLGGDQLGMPWSVFYINKIRLIFDDIGGNDGEAVTSMWGMYLDYLRLDEKALQDGLVPWVRSLLVHELFHLLQNNYDPRWYAKRRTWSDRRNEGGIYLWWNEAASVWAEEHFAALGDAKGKAPDNQRVNHLEPFNAMFVEGTKEVRQRHGYGMAALVKHVVKRSADGAKIVGRIYSDLYNHWLPTSAKHPVKAIFEAASSGDPNDKEWWFGFFRKYLPGELYSNSMDQLMLYFKDHPERVIRLSPGGTERVELSLDQKDLSAELYLIELSGAIGANDAVSVSALQVVDQFLAPLNAAVMFFSISDKRAISYLGGEGVYDVVLTQPDAAGMQKAGQKVLALVLNHLRKAPYTGSQTIFLDFFLGRPSFSVSTITADISGTITGVHNLFKLDDYPSSGTRTYGAHMVPATAVTVDAEITLNEPCEGTGNTFEVDVFGTKKQVDPCSGSASLAVEGYVPYPIDDSAISISYIMVNRSGTDVVIWPWGVK